jgi:hypothetical protein
VAGLGWARAGSAAVASNAVPSSAKRKFFIEPYSCSNRAGRLAGLIGPCAARLKMDADCNRHIPGHHRKGEKA